MKRERLSVLKKDYVDIVICGDKAPYVSYHDNRAHLGMSRTSFSTACSEYIHRVCSACTSQHCCA